MDDLINIRRKIKLTIAYNGANYAGWQVQNNAITVQGNIIEACKKIFKCETSVMGASRTDAGVHAYGQVATIEIESNIETKKIPYALNAHLPSDIVVQNAIEVDKKFHPRYNAKNKTYIYKIYNAEFPLPQLNDFTYFYYKKLDVKKMEIAAKQFIGEHDFKAFCSAGTSVKTTIRTIYDCSISKENNLITVSIKGNGFLYNMVRIIIGTLIEVGIGKTHPKEIIEIINSKNRSMAGKTAPAKGLSLLQIEY